MTTSWLEPLFTASAGAPAGAQYITLAVDTTLSAERALAVAAGQISGSDGGAGNSYTLGLATTAVTPGSYALATVTVDAYGRLTAASAATNIELPSSANRTISVADVAVGIGRSLTISPGETTQAGNAGGDMIVAAGTGLAGDDDGSLFLKDGSGNVAVTVGGAGAGAASASLSFYGVATTVTRQTVNWWNTDDATLKSLMAALVAVGLIDGVEQVA